MLTHLKATLPNNVKVTLLADRGFGAVWFYKALDDLGFDYVVRFKANITVTSQSGETRLAKEWLGKNGRAKRLESAEVTKESNKSIPVVICVQEKKMKGIWCLVASNTSLKTKEIINL